jgi:hypothetical protein
MSFFVVAFLLFCIVALLMLPRRLAALPLLMGACYIPFYSEALEIGPFHFTAVRVLIAVGLVRVIFRRERLAAQMHALDWLVLAWSFWTITNSLFHKDPSAELVSRLGETYNACGIYFLVRVFCQSFDDVIVLCRLIAVLLLPVALEMLYEKLSDNNLFYALAGSSLAPEIRNGRVRAQGPFAHAIFGGTSGAVCLPLLIPLWRQHRKTAIVGIVVCLAIIFASASSGPILSLMAGITALLLWRYRHRMRLIRWSLVAAYVALDLIMKDPAYFVLARIDLAGGSTGWHRARLIQASIEYFSDWALWGTDYTRHWIASGIPANENHTDLTNQYIAMGVQGGLPLMLLFIAILVTAFSFVGRIGKMSQLSPDRRWICWGLGASLFAHAVTFVSISYFDQSFVFLYLTLGAIGCGWATVLCDEGLHDMDTSFSDLRSPIAPLRVNPVGPYGTEPDRISAGLANGYRRDGSLTVEGPRNRHA